MKPPICFAGGPGWGPQVAKQNTSLNSCLRVTLHTLSQDCESGWFVVVRVMNKYNMRNFTTRTGEPMKMFSVLLVDRSCKGKYAKLVFFSAVADIFYNTIEQGNIYKISNVNIRPSRGQAFDPCSFEYELLASELTLIENLDPNTLEPGDANCPCVPHLYIQPPCDLGQISFLAENEPIDIVALVINSGTCVTLTSANGDPQIKRDITISDPSPGALLGAVGTSINMTLWKEEAVQFNGRRGDLVLLKGAQIRIYKNTRSISRARVVTVAPRTLPSSLLMLAQNLQSWFVKLPAEPVLNTYGWDPNSRAVELTLCGVARNTTLADQTLTVAGNVMAIATTGKNYYPACPTKDQETGRICRKKVEQTVDMNGGFSWVCAVCGVIPQPLYTLMLTVLLSDNSGALEIKGFGETAQAVLGSSATPDEIARLDNKRSGDVQASNKYKYCFEQIIGQPMICTVRTRLDTFRDQGVIIFNISNIKKSSAQQRMSMALTDLLAWDREDKGVAKPIYTKPQQKTNSFNTQSDLSSIPIKPVIKKENKPLHQSSIPAITQPVRGGNLLKVGAPLLQPTNYINNEEKNHKRNDSHYTEQIIEQKLDQDKISNSDIQENILEEKQFHKNNYENGYTQPSSPKQNNNSYQNIGQSQIYNSQQNLYAKKSTEDNYSQFENKHHETSYDPLSGFQQASLVPTSVTTEHNRNSIYETRQSKNDSDNCIYNGETNYDQNKTYEANNSHNGKIDYSISEPLRNKDYGDFISGGGNNNYSNNNINNGNQFQFSNATVMNNNNYKDNMVVNSEINNQNGISESRDINGGIKRPPMNEMSSAQRTPSQEDWNDAVIDLEQFF